MKVRGEWDRDAFAEEIPYDETRRYSKRVISSYFTYRYLLHDEIPVFCETSGCPPLTLRIAGFDRFLIDVRLESSRRPTHGQLRESSRRPTHGQPTESSRRPTHGQLGIPPTSR